MAIARKTVTVLFADLADSTTLAEHLDAEVLRSALSRWFDRAAAVIARQGGTVEKFIGDAVMAVFGVPRLHEDDALRALRAADELRTALADVNEEVRRELGVELAIRVGVNTGEVVVDDAGRALATGDAVNVAKRLEEAAGPGEVVVGDATRGLAGAAARFEPLGPLLAKGKSKPLRVWRLLEIERRAKPFERETPLVDRDGELEHLRRAYNRCAAESTCHLFTVLGAAGIGKSRLVAELLEEVSGDATFLVGRCLAYGEGITFWPLAEVLRQLGGDAGVADLLAGLPDAELVCERLRGVGGHTAPRSHETFWAVRQVCEALARRRPLVLCFEDVHWAEPTFLELIEYLATWIRGAPVLLLCLARPEFLDERPAWLAGYENAASLTLSPLSASASAQLLDALGASEDAAARIAAVADGNPLYAKQMLAALADADESQDLLAVPPTINALLAARLDRLAPDERAVVDRAAVCGPEFWRDAVVALTPVEDHDAVDGMLMSLVRKDLVRPHPSPERPDDAFRFGHVLIREAAYGSVPKQTRAELHERFADWLVEQGGGRGAELEELVGYHLEQAAVYRRELAPLDGRTEHIAARAGGLLASAGERALTRSDMPAAVNLLGRGAALLDERDPDRLRALLSLGSALTATGDFAGAEAALAEAVVLAAAAGERSLELRASIEREFVRTFTEPGRSTDELVRVSEAAIPVLEELEDDCGVAKAWWLRSEADVIAGRFGPRAEALERALVYARRAGDRRTGTAIVALLAQALAYGPAPVTAATRRCHELRASADGDQAVEAAIESTLGMLAAMEGRFAEARETYARAQARYDELGLRYMRAVRSLEGSSVELLAGEVDTAVAELRGGYDALERMGERGARSTIAAFLAHALVGRGTYEEADSFARIAEETGAPADVVTQAVWRSARARCLARAGDADGAERLAREAVDLAGSTDCLELQARTLLDLADVLRAIGRSDETLPLVAAARERYERKGNLVAAEQAAHAVALPSAQA